MAQWPKIYTPDMAPRELVEFVGLVMPKLLVGEHSSLVPLRDQFRESRIESVTLTGAGFYVNFLVPLQLPRVVPADFAGGSVNVGIAGLERGLGCILFVRNGQIAFLEGYTYQEVWPEKFQITLVEIEKPLEPPSPFG
jgi:hypothetical protein